MGNILFAPIAIPAAAGILSLLIPDKVKKLKEILVLIASIINLIFAVILLNKEFNYSVPWAGFGLDFSLRLYHFSAFIILAIAGFTFLIALYSTAFMKEKKYLNQFYSYMLLSVAMANGAVLADNLALMLFFWEGLLVTLFGMIAIGHKGAYKTAVKTLVISGITDLCLMIGIGLTYYMSGTLTISQISIPLDSIGCLAFIFMMIGAISKAGAMPFHSWIPDAAEDAPLPFMAFLPAALEKLLGIYLLARISLDMFQLHHGSWVSMFLMIVGCITMLLAAMMTLVQKNYKRMLSYCAISQVGYMILGIGTCVPAGIVGGLFHMINHTMYKSCLFLTGGAVEKQTGTTDLAKLGGLRKKMPITFLCFIIAAAAIAGVPPLNGFFSKELVYDGALERHWIFYAAAILGSFLTTASFFKLGHAAFFGKINDDTKNAKEVSWEMTIPMITIASLCVLFGVYNYLPLNKLIQPIISNNILEGRSFSGMPANMMLVVMSLIVVIAAFINHIFGVKKTGSGAGAADHIRYAPVLSKIYDSAEKRYLDPYNIGLRFADIMARTALSIDRAINWVYDRFTVDTIYAFTSVIKKMHSGSYSVYVIWALFGFVIIVFVI